MIKPAFMKFSTEIGVICLEDKAFKAVIDTVVKYLKEEHGIKESKWISPEQAMHKLNISSKKTLHNRANVSQPLIRRVVKKQRGASPATTLVEKRTHE